MDETKVTGYEAVNDIASRIAKVEDYKSKKDPKRPQVAIGDIRQILGIMADMMYGDPKVIVTMRNYGMQRKKVRASKGSDEADAQKEEKATKPKAKAKKS